MWVMPAHALGKHIVDRRELQVPDGKPVLAASVARGFEVQRAQLADHALGAPGLAFRPDDD